MKETKTPAPEKTKRTRKKIHTGDAIPAPKREKEERVPFRTKGEAEEWMRREALVASLTVAFFFLWWILALYRETEKRRFLLGMPDWFFYGAIVGTAVFVVLVLVIGKTVLRETETEDAKTAEKPAEAVLDTPSEETDDEDDWEAAAAKALSAKNASLAKREEDAK